MLRLRTAGRIAIANYLRLKTVAIMPLFQRRLNHTKKPRTRRGFSLKPLRITLEIQLLVFHVSEYQGHAVGLIQLVPVLASMDIQQSWFSGMQSRHGSKMHQSSTSPDGQDRMPNHHAEARHNVKRSTGS